MWKTFEDRKVRVAGLHVDELGHGIFCFMILDFCVRFVDLPSPSRGMLDPRARQRCSGRGCKVYDNSTVPVGYTPFPYKCQSINPRAKPQSPLLTLNS